MDHRQMEREPRAGLGEKMAPKDVSLYSLSAHQASGAVDLQVHSWENEPSLAEQNVPGT